MDFSEALKALKEGCAVRRPEWVGYLKAQFPDEHSANNQPYLYALCRAGERVPAHVNNLDMFADDWIVLTKAEESRVHALVNAK